MTRTVRTVYGFTNYRFHVNDPRGETTWFATRKQRDEARADLIESAQSAGLHHAESAFTRVTFTARKGCSDKRTARLEYLREMTRDGRAFTETNEK